MTTTTVDVLTAMSIHLKEFKLPAIASVHITTYTTGAPVTAQLPGREPAAITAGLLAWTRVNI